MRLERRILLILAIIVLLPPIAGNYFWMIVRSRDRLDYEVASHTSQVLQVVNLTGYHAIKTPPGLLDRFGHEPDTIALEVVFPDGRVVASNVPALVGHPSQHPAEVQEVLQNGQVISRLLVAPRGQPARERPITTSDYALLAQFREPIVHDLWVPLTNDRSGAIDGVLYLRVSHDRMLDSVRSLSLVQFIIALLAASTICLIIRLALARWIERPLAELGAVAARVAAGDRSARAHVGPNDAIGQLAREFNAMTDTLVLVEREADSDPVVGLLNHRALHRRLEHEVARARERGTALSVLMLDLDGFKGVNDTWGHQIGDRVLVAIGDILKRHARRSDIVGRYGGDEFMVILLDADRVGVALLAERIESAIGTLAIPEIAGHVPVGASIGIATTPDHGDTADALVAHADAMLYAVKRDRKLSRHSHLRAAD